MGIALLQDKIAYKVSGKNRRKKFDYFVEIFEPDSNTQILDVGPSEGEFSPTDNLIEKLYPFQKRLTALGIEEFDNFRSRYPDVNLKNYDGYNFPFSERSFDICWSNAVIEHVGDYQRQVHFLEEIARVSRNAFITTPNKFFPIEVHTRTPFLHFLPKPVFDRYLKMIGKSWAADDYMNLLSYGDIKRLLADAGIAKYKIKKNRFFGFVLDFIIIFGDHFEEKVDTEKMVTVA